jgi:hypothetical protein
MRSLARAPFAGVDSRTLKAPTSKVPEPWAEARRAAAAPAS